MRGGKRRGKHPRMQTPITPPTPSSCEVEGRPVINSPSSNKRALAVAGPGSRSCFAAEDNRIALLGTNTHSSSSGHPVSSSCQHLPTSMTANTSPPDFSTTWYCTPCPSMRISRSKVLTAIKRPCKGASTSWFSQVHVLWMSERRQKGKPHPTPRD